MGRRLGSRGSFEFTGTAQPKRTVGVWKLMFLAFFLVCGGPAGIEPIVRATGPLIALLGLVGMTCFYAVPQAMMTAELSSMIDMNGGYVHWVRRAFGDFPGFMNAYNSMACNIIDQTTYPVVLAAYMIDVDGKESAWTLFLVKLGMVLAVMVVNLIGTDMVALSSAGLFVVVMAPYVIVFILCFDDISPATQWTGMLPWKDMNWSLYFGTLIWSFTGWDGIGTVAGEVNHVGSVYPRTVAVVIVLTLACNFLPVVAGLSVHREDTHWSEWHEGYLGVVSKDVRHWLGWWVMFSTMASTVGIYSANLVEVARGMWAMGRDDQKTGDGLYLPSLFGHTHARYNTPDFAIVFNSLTTIALMNIPFETLVQCDSLLNCISLLFEFGAFLHLKHKEPFAHRPYRVPGGLVGAYLLSLPKFIFIVIALCFFDRRTWTTCLLINAVFLLIYAFRAAFHSAPTSLDERAPLVER